MLNHLGFPSKRRAGCYGVLALEDSLGDHYSGALFCLENKAQRFHAATLRPHSEFLADRGQKPGVLNPRLTGFSPPQCYGLKSNLSIPFWRQKFILYEALQYGGETVKGLGGEKQDACSNTCKQRKCDPGTPVLEVPYF